MYWYLEALKKYAVFSGRARRKEFWLFFLVDMVITIVLGFIENLMGDTNIIITVYSLATFIPALSVTVRRLHDTNHSGWWLLIILIPLIGAFLLIVFYALDSQSGSNKYGQNPKNRSLTTAFS